MPSTVCPSVSRRCARWKPMKPAVPVIRKRIRSRLYSHCLQWPNRQLKDTAVGRILQGKLPEQIRLWYLGRANSSAAKASGVDEREILRPLGALSAFATKAAI